MEKTIPCPGILAAPLAGLPLEKRLQVQGLLADLHSNLDERGLITTVPGELLFAMDSDEVQVGRLRHARQGGGTDRHARRPTGAHHWP